MNRATVLALFVGAVGGGTVTAGTEIFAQVQRPDIRWPLNATTVTKVCVVTDKHGEADGGITIDGVHVEVSADVPSLVPGEPTERCDKSLPLSAPGRTAFRDAIRDYVFPGARAACGLN
jgi:hypothetical protein